MDPEMTLFDLGRNDMGILLNIKRNNEKLRESQRTLTNKEREILFYGIAKIIKSKLGFENLVS